MTNRILLSIFAAILLASCAAHVPPSCPGYERVTVGSGCRAVATGNFVAADKCNCGAR